MLQLRNILVATDYSPTSEVALAYAVDLAALVGAAVHVVHAYEIPVYGAPDAAFVATPEMTASIKEAAQKGLDAAMAAHQGRGVALQAHLMEGRPWEVVRAAAKQIGADLVVIGTHGRRGLSRALLGSVAEKVVRTATLPVLTVHGAEHEAAAPG